MAFKNCSFMAMKIRMLSVLDPPQVNEMITLDAR